ncbi:hypothetical protein B0T26DRAFT_102357 [Lasiosphaeria miniovina]|uniref:Uncharacterized protein n=1 Tax=Lasiosphaeria miniovina TaxID=1954250 RepID=A0AA40E7D9_9PEZI|nr:uncharacterized protein B0T26DRAFT_102357 [Lasiosphaeria miniovina]KAK0726756.1 hypothetical protein B0T26DRAFT_102357 [Lasiosphaeria miniovina]
MSVVLVRSAIPSNSGFRVCLARHWTLMHAQRLTPHHHQSHRPFSASQFVQIRPPRPFCPAGHCSNLYATSTATASCRWPNKACNRVPAEPAPRAPPALGPEVAMSNADRQRPDVTGGIRDRASSPFCVLLVEKSCRFPGSLSFCDRHKHAQTHSHQLGAVNVLCNAKRRVTLATAWAFPRANVSKFSSLTSAVACVSTRTVRRGPRAARFVGPPGQMHYWLIGGLLPLLRAHLLAPALVLTVIALPSRFATAVSRPFWLVRPLQQAPGPSAQAFATAPHHPP